MSDDVEPLLSGDEMQVLLQAMRSNSSKGVAAETLDFSSDDRRLRLQTKRADRAVHELVVELRKLLRRVLGTSLILQEKPSELVSYEMFATAMKPGYAIAELRTVSGAEGYLVIGSGLTSYVLNKRLGADVENMEFLAPRLDMSLMDKRVLKAFFAQLVTLMSQTISGKPDAFTIAQIVSRPGDLLAKTEGSNLLRMFVASTIPKIEPEEIQLFVSSGALGDIIPGDEPVVTAPSTPINENDRKRLLDRLNVTELDVVARLGSTQSSIRRLIDLKVGDVLRLQQIPDEPLTVYVAGVPKLRGLPVNHHGNMAVKITESIKTEGNEK